MKFLILSVVLLLSSFTSVAQDYVSTITDTNMVAILRRYVLRYKEPSDQVRIDKANTVLVLSMFGDSPLSYSYSVGCTQRQDILSRELPSHVAQVDGFWVLYYRIRPDELASATVRPPDGYRAFLQKRVQSTLQPIPPFETVTTTVGVPPNQRTVSGKRDPRKMEGFETWVVRCKAGQKPDVKIAL